MVKKKVKHLKRGDHDLLFRFTRILGVKGFALNAIHFSAMQRNRLWWTNIPVRRFMRRKQTLQNVISDKSGDKALFKQIQTITTKPGSLLQGKLLSRLLQMPSNELIP